jgi:hypothetical protein
MRRRLPTRWSRTELPKEWTAPSWSLLEAWFILPTFLWNYGLRHATRPYISWIEWQQSPSKGRPPMKFGKVWSRIYLTSGCLAETSTKEKRKKLEPKSIKCCHVGYCELQKGFRALNQGSGKVLISRDVIFQEFERGLPGGPPCGISDLIDDIFDR